jgi:flagellar hook-length control protein FliK
MIELSTTVAKPALVTPGPAASGAPPGGFALALAAFLDLAAGGTPGATPEPVLPGDRQGLADDGKTLPGGDKADDTDSRDPALIWLPIPLPQQQLPVTPPPAPTLGGTRTPVEIDANALLGAAGTAATATPGIAADAHAKDVTAPTTTALLDKAPPAAIAENAAPADLPRVAATAHGDVAVPQAAPTAQPAGQVFAAAIAAAAGRKDQPTRDSDSNQPGQSTAPIATAQIETAHKPIVQPTAETKHAPLDLRNDRGLQGMIDRIETLRDDANAHDTRIRLVPDALGGIDLSVRKEGDAVHVHFTADSDATRSLLTDAQPRLAELAEARGVKLGGTTVDSRNGGSADPQPRSQQTPPPAPVSVTAGTTDTDMPTDQRVA